MLFILTALYLLVFLRRVIKRQGKLIIFKLEKIDSSGTLFPEFLENANIIYYDYDKYDHLPVTLHILGVLQILLAFINFFGLGNRNLSAF